VSISTSPTVRCPSCSATIRAGSDWCTLCYADLRPAPPAPVEPVAAPVEPVVPVEPVASAPAEPEALEPVAVTPSRGKHAKGAPASAGDGPSGPVAEAERLADTMLAQLAASESKHPLGSLAGAVDTSGKRTALMIGGSVAAMCVLFGLMALLGLLL
jgi:hypothetical protein